MTAPRAIEAVEITDAGACRMHKFPTEISTYRNLKCRLGLGAFVTPRASRDLQRAYRHKPVVFAKQL